MKVSVLKDFAGPGVRLAVVSVFLLGMAGIAQAQASGAAAQSTTKTAAATGQGKAEPAAVAPGKSPAKGNHEGIKVHGHWTIEVRNPDGKLVSHTEFENALVQPGGASYITQLMLGTTVPGGYSIYMTSGPAAGGFGPCAGGDECILSGSITSPTPGSFSNSVVTAACLSAPGTCFPLTVTPNMPVSGGVTSEGFTLTGTATTPASTGGGTITDVYVYPLTCGNPTITTSTQATAISPSTCASTATVVQLSLTHAPNVAVPVTAGQSIAVNVQLSFQ
jgi:hypothetical protein